MDQPGTRGFRAGLRAALPRWRAEGIVDEATAARLAERHALADPALDGLGLLPVYVLAALLVGAGVASLVAWHWDELGRTVKVALVFGLVVAAHLAGDRLRRAGRHPRLGEGVQLLGSLLFGAGIGLMAQIFQVSGEWYGIFGGFAVGAVGAGLLLDSPTTLVAAAVAAVALWASGWTADHPGGLGLLVPYAAAAPFLIVGWLRRSRALLAVTALGLGVAAAASVGDFRLLALPALCVGAGLLAVPLATPRDDAPLAAALAGAGRIGFALAGFSWPAFHDGARALADALSSASRHQGVEAASVAAGLAACVLVLGLAWRRAGPLALAQALAAALGVGGVGLGVRLGSPVLVAVAANAALLALAGLRIAEGLSTARRVAFWEGVALGGALLVARFLEIEQHLWLKGLGFIACGAAVAWGALAFERRRQEVRHAA